MSPASAPSRPPNAPAWGGRFGLVWAGQSASLLGDQVTLIALPLLAVGYAGASTFDVGVLGMCLRLPFLGVGLPTGVWVTRSGLLRSMIAADIARDSAIGLLPALALAGMTRLPLLIAAACVVGVGTVFFQVSYQSDITGNVPAAARWPPMVPRRRRPRSRPHPCLCSASPACRTSLSPQRGAPGWMAGLIVALGASVVAGRAGDHPRHAPGR